MKTSFYIGAFGSLFLALISTNSKVVESSDALQVKTSHPNILLIVADDLGYTDIGVFGGEIETPNLDALAQSGQTFTRFHTAPYCAVTRAMLLSGNDNHTAGMGSQDLPTAEYGYEGCLSERVIPLPQMLKEAGYQTSMAGKWHLGKLPSQDPSKKGFDHSFILQDGGGNHYSSKGVFGGTPVSEYRENGVEVNWPEGSYSTNFYTDKLIEYIDKSESQPFFAFAAYTSPHWPLQVDAEYWHKYKGKYDDGYEKLREKRFENQKKLGILPEDAVLPEMHPRVKPWGELSAEEKKIEARKMELYAGMVDNLDANIGRLISHLKETGEFENTLIIFLSDNGAASEDFYSSKHYGAFLRENYTDNYDEMGKVNSFISYGPQWAEAGSAPFKYFKGYTTEGGTNTPMMISGPGIENRGSRNEVFASIIDIAPTLYELAGITYPQKNGEQDLPPLKGESMLPYLSNDAQQVHNEEYVFALEHRGRIVIRKGNWKLVNIETPLKEEGFELYDLSSDLSEQKNLRDQEPKKFKELFTEWEKYRDQVRVQNPPPKRL